MNSALVLWIYIVFLIAGGLIGFLKAGSKVSLLTSLAFALALIVCVIGWLRVPYLTDALLVLLLVVFVLRFAKTRKFMPAGLLMLLTVVTLALQHLLP